MSGFLFDTSSISRLAPNQPALAPAVIRAIRRHQPRIYLSSIAIAEIVAGIEKLARSGATRRAETVMSWLTIMETAFGERILPFDGRAAHLAGRLSDAATAAGRNPGFADVAIAAIALDHRLAVVTENARHFQHPGLDALSPQALR